MRRFFSNLADDAPGLFMWVVVLPVVLAVAVLLMWAFHTSLSNY